MVRGGLPTRDRLQQKWVPCTDLCPHCETTYENEWHLFISCTKAREVWLRADLWEVVRSLTATAVGFVELIFSALTTLEGERKQDFVMIYIMVFMETAE
ncbi:BZIP-like protein [Trifolium medium]|uniref:BZIP-like protein n=1 Tax=Trifolium medium TaxID=97028 RepID=A0A392M1V9_9FABA|nr:BZIP-like protein [Trifolium medium]